MRKKNKTHFSINVYLLFEYFFLSRIKSAEKLPATPAINKHKTTMSRRLVSCMDNFCAAGKTVEFESIAQKIAYTLRFQALRFSTNKYTLTDSKIRTFHLKQKFLIASILIPSICPDCCLSSNHLLIEYIQY